jgi:methylated-DNA-[protein]-cysteine S-methyltransferase
MMNAYTDHIVQSPIGELHARWCDDKLLALSFADQNASAISNFSPVDHSLLRKDQQKLQHELEAYFSGQLDHFSCELKLEGTEFQKRVWTELCRIPYGSTWSYLELAEALGQKEAIRAVGTANGANPIAIIVPCHRVIGSDGRLRGYAGGVERKKYLLQLEMENSNALGYNSPGYNSKQAQGSLF